MRALNSILIEGEAGKVVAPYSKWTSPSAAFDLHTATTLGEPMTVRVASNRPDQVGRMVTTKAGTRVRIVGRIDRDDAGLYVYAEHSETVKA